MTTVRRLSFTTALTSVALLGAAAAPPALARPGVPPRPALTVAPNPAQVNQAVNFDAAGSTGDGQGSTIARYEWDLDGDGIFETDTGGISATTRAYARAQTITVRLRITDNEGDFAEVSADLRINAPPVAGFIYQPSSPQVRERVVLSSTSSDPDGSISPNNYAWDLDGDGQFDDATGETVATKFKRAGEQKVRLRVIDNDGAPAKAVRKLRIEGKQSELKLMKPFPTVRLRGAITSGGQTEIDLLSVRGPQGAKAAVVCRGDSCPFERRKRRIRKRRVQFPEIERRLKPGVVIEVSVTQPDRIGKFTRFKLRDGRVPKREDRCIKPGGGHPIDCPRG